MIAIYPAQRRSHHSNLISLSFKRYIFQMWAYKSAFYQRPTAEQRGYTVDNTIIFNTLNKIYYGIKFNKRGYV